MVLGNVEDEVVHSAPPLQHRKFSRDSALCELACETGEKESNEARVAGEHLFHWDAIVFAKGNKFDSNASIGGEGWGSEGRGKDASIGLESGDGDIGKIRVRVDWAQKEEKSFLWFSLAPSGGETIGRRRWVVPVPGIGIGRGGRIKEDVILARDVEVWRGDVDFLDLEVWEDWGIWFTDLRRFVGAGSINLRFGRGEDGRVVWVKFQRSRIGAIGCLERLKEGGTEIVVGDFVDGVEDVRHDLGVVGWGVRVGDKVCAQAKFFGVGRREKVQGDKVVV